MDIVKEVLNYVVKKEKVSSQDLADILKVDHQKIVGAIKSIQSFGDVLNCEQKLTTHFELTDEGKDVALNGSYEVNVLKAITTDDGILQSELMNSVKNAKIGFSKAIANKWIRIDKAAPGGTRVFSNTNLNSIKDEVQLSLQNLNHLDDQKKAEYKKRKLITELKQTIYILCKGPSFTLDLQKQETDLTLDLLSSGAWKEKSFKAYNFAALGLPPTCGHLHPLLKVRAEFRRILMDMGFSEMSANTYVESSFWNFDVLFQPQQHPARDAHDTFFLSDPAITTRFPNDYLERVGQVHSLGGYGSQGYRYNWKLEEAQKNILRTHTTPVSARLLYKLAQQKEFTPIKSFSIDRVFRNETLDATHLAEFHQIEGMVADRNLTLGHLKGTIHAFFKKLGLSKLRFKPAYNPYTEPSMEIFSYHEGLKKWVEVGNSGIYRPEMLLPMGLPEDVTVIAWGLSLERPTMIKYGYNNIRDLIGPRVDLRMVNDSPICRLDK